MQTPADTLTEHRVQRVRERDRPPRAGVEFVLLATALSGLGVGGISYLVDAASLSRWAYRLSVVVVLIPTAFSTVRRLLNREMGVDLIAVLAMSGALVLGEYLAGAILAVMLKGGTALERFAIARARRELSALVKRAPRTAHRRAGTDITDIGVDEVALGDLLVVKPGEVVPVDGILSSGSAVLDESALTGESNPVRLEPGQPLRGGGTNAGAPFELRVTAPAAESTYAGIIRLVRAAEESKAPFERLADRFALGFLALTLALAAFAWIAGGNVLRALSVLVVATPCPLILAGPAAIIAGVSRAAKVGRKCPNGWKGRWNSAALPQPRATIATPVRLPRADSIAMLRSSRSRSSTRAKLSNPRSRSSALCRVTLCQPGSARWQLGV